MGIFNRRKYIEPKRFKEVANNLVASFESLREEYLIGSLMQLKRERTDISKISRDIIPGSEIDDLLKGFQLTSMMGVAYDYIKDTRDWNNFDRMLCAHLNSQEGSQAWSYRRK